MVKTKNILAILILLFVCNVGIYSQTLVDQYGRLSSDDISARLDTFVNAIQADPSSTAFIRLTFNEKLERHGTVVVRSEGIKDYLVRHRGLNPARLKIIVVNGGDDRYVVQLWKYPEGVSLPEVSSLDWDIETIREPYLYTLGCSDCSPVVPELSEQYMLKHFAETLKNHRNLKGLIVIRRNSFFDSNFRQRQQAAIQTVSYFRDLFNRIYGLEKNQLKIVIRNSKDAGVPESADFYILPKKRNKENTIIRVGKHL
ncbi:MAG: hypothetical protein KDB79_07320 [Acidobacteria bacterium]|nr:hypothetical protein [Acidobacteriota bacterium]